MSTLIAIADVFSLMAGRGWLELPAWYGAGLYKGAGHKYIKRVPRAGGGYRYFYKVGHGGTVAAKDHMVVGASFRGESDGKQGHFHIVSADGDTLKVRHDETGKTETIGRKDLAARLGKQHATGITAHADRIRADWKAAHDNGASEKQKAKIEQRAKAAGLNVKAKARVVHKVTPAQESSLEIHVPVYAEDDGIEDAEFVERHQLLQRVFQHGRIDLSGHDIEDVQKVAQAVADIADAERDDMPARAKSLDSLASAILDRAQADANAERFTVGRRMKLAGRAVTIAGVNTDGSVRVYIGTPTGDGTRVPTDQLHHLVPA